LSIERLPGCSATGEKSPPRGQIGGGEKRRKAVKRIEGHWPPTRQSELLRVQFDRAQNAKQRAMFYLEEKKIKADYLGAFGLLRV